MAIHTTGILVRGIHTQYGRILSGCRYPDILALLHPVVEGYIECTKQLGIDTNIILVSLFVAGVGCCHLAQVGATEL